MAAHRASRGVEIEDEHGPLRERAEIADAVVIYKNYRAAGGTWDPQSNGSVLTIPRIENYLRVQNLKNPNFVAGEVKKAQTKVA